MDVISKDGVFKDEDADVAHGAEIHVLSDLVLDEALVDERVEDPLAHRWNGRNRLNEMMS